MRIFLKYAITGLKRLTYFFKEITAVDITQNPFFKGNKRCDLPGNDFHLPRIMTTADKTK